MWYELESGRKSPRSRVCSLGFPSPWTPWAITWPTAQPPFSSSSLRNCCCSVAKSCLTLCDPKDCSTPGFPVLHCLAEFAQTHVHRLGDAIQPSHPLSSLLLLPAVFPSIRVFSNELALCIRRPEYWSFSFAAVLPMVASCKRGISGESLAQAFSASRNLYTRPTDAAVTGLSVHLVQN